LALLGALGELSGSKGFLLNFYAVFEMGRIRGNSREKNHSRYFGSDEALGRNEDTLKSRFLDDSNLSWGSYCHLLPLKGGVPRKGTNRGITVA
jgi:hypothetical protein